MTENGFEIKSDENLRLYVKKEKNIQKCISIVFILILFIAIVLMCMIRISKLESTNDRLTNEIEKLDRKNTELVKTEELEIKVVEIKARVEEQNEHAKFVLYVLQEASGEDFSDVNSQLEEVYNAVLTSIEAFQKLSGNGGIATEYIGEDTLDTIINGIDEIYESWDKMFDSIMEMEKYITKN